MGTVICLHGFACLPSMWDAVAEKLPEPLLTPLLPGHGRGGPSHQAARFMDVVAALWAEHGASAAGPLHLVGYSLGARLALAMALQRPASVASLLLIGGTAGIDDDSQRRERQAWDEAQAQRLEQLGVEAFMDQWERLPLFASQTSLPPAERQHIRRQRDAHSAAGLARVMRVLGQGSMPSLWSRLPELSMPVTLLVGRLDAKFAAIAERMRARHPSMRLRWADGAGHNVVAEAPARVAAAITLQLRVGESREASDRLVR